MTVPDIALQRLYNQRLSQPEFKNPAEVVAWLGAVQAQDFLGSLWALAQRMETATEKTVEKAFTDGSILRTHALRPTWHFVTPADIRWILGLTAPRVNAINAYMYRQLELDDALFSRTNTVITKVLQGGQQLTRAELGAALEEAGIAAVGMRLGYIVHRAELDAVVCSGPRRGKQFTYALLDERAPQTRTWKRDEALAELTLRYYTGHGPATIPDFVWWSGLTVADAKAGIETVRSQLVQETIDSQTYWMSPTTPDTQAPSPTAYLLPAYDEFLLSYRDRSASLKPEYATLWSRENAVFNSTIVVSGQVIGAWRRTFSKRSVVLESTFFTTLTAAENDAFAAAVHRYGEFLNVPVVTQ